MVIDMTDLQVRSITNWKTIHDNRSVIVRKMRSLHESAEAARRAFTDSETREWEALDRQVETLDRQLRREAFMVADAPIHPTQYPERGDQRYAEVFRAYVRNGINCLNNQQQAMLAAHATPSDGGMRAFGSSVGNQGGFTAPDGFFDHLELALKTTGPMLDEEIVTVVTTESGTSFPMPTANDVATMGVRIGENVQVGLDSSAPFGSIPLDAYIYSSLAFPVSIGFVQDSKFPELAIASLVGGRIGRILNQERTLGTGVGQPMGIVTAATVGKVGVTGQTATVTFDDIVDLVHAVNPAYRKLKPSFMMHDLSVSKVRKIKDADGRPIFLPGLDLSGPAPDTILGYPVHVNDDVPVMAANAKSILFGPMKKYHARNVRQTSVLRLDERYADNLQVGFIGFLRAGGALLDAGTNPIKYYQNSAT
jgi:HK97 family phage major capsid protein